MQVGVTPEFALTNGVEKYSLVHANVSTTTISPSLGARTRDDLLGWRRTMSVSGELTRNLGCDIR